MDGTEAIARTAISEALSVLLAPAACSNSLIGRFRSTVAPGLIARFSTGLVEIFEAHRSDSGRNVFAGEAPVAELHHQSVAAVVLGVKSSGEEQIARPGAKVVYIAPVELDRSVLRQDIIRIDGIDHRVDTVTAYPAACAPALVEINVERV